MAKAWRSYTPTLTNITLGNGSVAAAYTQIGKTISFRILITFGSTSAMGSSPFISLPVNAAAAYASGFSSVGVCDCLNAGVAAFGGQCRLDTGTDIYPYPANGAGGQLVALSSTVPFTWGTGDQLTLTGTYEAA